MSVELLGKSLSDLSIVTMIFRIILSMACGGVIGLERGKANQPAGMRTYMLVSLGSCVVMITGEFLFYKYGAGDPARLGAQVVSGIGFLGAGSIVTQDVPAGAVVVGNPARIIKEQKDEKTEGKTQLMDDLRKI